ncbi:hypothetical protein FIV00_26040 [Labrenzia sp. THAF82]|uniref:hypothetical protein n=1 Tax=Labrenzia sp. THAF82 TaxID=2587861 RepID=UPI001267A231|nr:hypothetical protein [Labrenzia sp. THAF82]QFT33984.1 hypothetical protein FIV00_26040 [Labrenzia sp. THAF82]
MSILTTLNLQPADNTLVGMDASQAGTKAECTLVLDSTAIEALKVAAEDRENRHATDALDALVQLIAHDDKLVRQTALNAVRDLPSTLSPQINERLSKLFEIATGPRTTLLNMEAVAFASYHTAKQELDLGNSGGLYQGASRAWDMAAERLKEGKWFSEIVEAFENKFENLLFNNRYISNVELKSYAETGGKNVEEIKYLGPFDPNSGEIDQTATEITIRTTLVDEHYVHVLHRGNEVCVLDTLGTFKQRRTASAAKFADFRQGWTTTEGNSFFEVNVNLQNCKSEVPDGLPNAQGVGLPNACAIFGPALQDWLLGRPDLRDKSLNDLVTGFTEHVREMSQDQRQEMNDGIRFKFLDAAMSHNLH